MANGGVFEIGFTIGFAVTAIFLLGIAVPLAERYETIMTYHFDPDYVTIRKKDAAAMAAALLPAIAASYTLINVNWLNAVLGGMNLGFIFVIELITMYILSLADPPFTGAMLKVDAVIVASTSAYTLINWNIYAAIALFIVSGIIAAIFIFSDLDVLLCRRISTWLLDCSEYCSGCDCKLHKFEYEWCKARWEAGYRTPCSCRKLLKCCKSLESS